MKDGICDDQALMVQDIPAQRLRHELTLGLDALPRSLNPHTVKPERDLHRSVSDWSLVDIDVGNPIKTAKPSHLPGKPRRPFVERIRNRVGPKVDLEVRARRRRRGMSSPWRRSPAPPPPGIAPRGREPNGNGHGLPELPGAEAPSPQVTFLPARSSGDGSFRNVPVPPRHG